MRCTGTRRWTGSNNAASIPIPWPTGAPTSSAGPPGWIAPSWRISAPMVRWECITPFGSDVVPDVYAIKAGASGSTAAGAAIGSSATSSVNERFGAGIADDRGPFEVGQVRTHRIEVGDEVEVAEVVCGDECLHSSALQDVQDLLRSVEVDDGHDDRAEVGHRVERRRGLDPVRELECDRVTGADAARSEAGGHAAGQRVDVTERAAIRRSVGAHRERRLRCI